MSSKKNTKDISIVEMIKHPYFTHLVKSKSGIGGNDVFTVYFESDKLNKEGKYIAFNGDEIMHKEHFCLKEIK